MIVEVFRTPQLLRGGSARAGQRERVKALLEKIECRAFDQNFQARVGTDNCRCWLQLVYTTGGEQWRGRKWFLSAFMTDDEIVKTVWLAFEIAVRHELLEGFRFDGKLVFNPHTPFAALIDASQTQEFRSGGAE